MEETTLPGVSCEEGGLDGVWVLEQGQSLETDYDLPIVLLAVGKDYR